MFVKWKTRLNGASLFRYWYIEVEDFPAHIKVFDQSRTYGTSTGYFSEDVIVPFEKIKEEAVRHALKITKGNILEAAKKLQLGRATIYRLMERYKIDSKDLNKN